MFCCQHPPLYRRRKKLLGKNTRPRRSLRKHKFHQNDHTEIIQSHELFHQLLHFQVGHTDEFYLRLVHFQALDTMSTQVITRPLTPYEEQINKKICEIILTIHESKEYVSRERVQRELFDFYHVDSWTKLGVHGSRFNPLINLTDRQKSVTFYMKIFEQIFNLCTLHDLDSLLARFLQVENYADLRLGPLDKNPDIRQIFAYNPTDRDQAIPDITTGQVICRFMEFMRTNRQKRQMPFDAFLDDLVKRYKLQSREELGIYCKSFPYLVQVMQL